MRCLGFLLLSFVLSSSGDVPDDWVIQDNLQVLDKENTLNTLPVEEKADDDDEDDVSLPAPEMIEKNGYPVEIHTVTTEDGYILTMHRIPHGLKSPASRKKPVVFLQHGLLCSSADYVMSSPEKSLGYILADAGYDVWMGNFRGNTYSRKHTTYSTSDKEFWKFSWDQMGYYDLPAQIDYVLENTGHKSIYYIGHSMGTTTFFVMTSTRPEYNDKIHLMLALAPVATVGHMRSPLRLLAPFVFQVQWLTNMMGMHEFFPSSGLMEFFAATVCAADLMSIICSNIVFMMCGFNKDQLDMDLLPTIIGHTPAGASTQTLVHYAQEVNTEKFTHYSYGKQGNLQHYGQKEPPEYDLSKITTPVALYWGENDWMAAPQDVFLLAPKLKNLVGKFRVNLDSFNHMDFLWAIDADKLLYKDILEMLERF